MMARLHLSARLNFDAPRLALRLACAAALLGGLAQAAPLQVGDPLPRAALPDQHGRPLAVDEATRLVVFAADKGASDLAGEVLRTLPAGEQARRGIVYLADISAMPVLITRLVALPRLRDQPYRVGLAYEADSLADWPRTGGQVSVLSLREGRIAAIDQAGDAAALRALLGLGAP